MEWTSLIYCINVKPRNISKLICHRLPDMGMRYKNLSKFRITFNQTSAKIYRFAYILACQYFGSEALRLYSNSTEEYPIDPTDKYWGVGKNSRKAINTPKPVRRRRVFGQVKQNPYLSRPLARSDNFLPLNILSRLSQAFPQLHYAIRRRFHVIFDKEHQSSDFRYGRRIYVVRQRKDGEMAPPISTRASWSQSKTPCRQMCGWRKTPDPICASRVCFCFSYVLDLSIVRVIIWSSCSNH